jgi:hypothetical protein
MDARASLRLRIARHRHRAIAARPGHRRNRRGAEAAHHRRPRHRRNGRDRHDPPFRFDLRQRSAHRLPARRGGVHRRCAGARERHEDRPCGASGRVGPRQRAGHPAHRHCQRSDRPYRENRAQRHRRARTGRGSSRRQATPRRRRRLRGGVRPAPRQWRDRREPRRAARCRTHQGRGADRRRCGRPDVDWRTHFAWRRGRTRGFARQPRRRAPRRRLQRLAFPQPRAAFRSGGRPRLD